MNFKKKLDSVYGKMIHLVGDLDVKVDSVVDNIDRMSPEERIKYLSDLSDNVIKNSEVKL